MSTRIALLLLILSLSACNSVWKRVDSEMIDYSGLYYAVSLPEGWMRIIDQNKDLIVTNDGILIQKILVKHREHEKAFEKIEKKSDTDLLPSELADLYLAELKATDENGLPSLQIISNEPVQVAGREGFKIRARYANEDGLRYGLISVGFVQEKGFYTVEYIAPELHFFERDVATFESFLGSLRLI